MAMQGEWKGGTCCTVRVASIVQVAIVKQYKVYRNALHTADGFEWRLLLSIAIVLCKIISTHIVYVAALSPLGAPRTLGLATYIHI